MQSSLIELERKVFLPLSTDIADSNPKGIILIMDIADSLLLETRYNVANTKYIKREKYI